MTRQRGEQVPLGREVPVQRGLAGLYVGRHNGEPVTDDYPGQPPYAFTGGTIDRVAVDVSGEPYMDLEPEAALMIMRE
jgi:hypothetical protein